MGSTLKKKGSNLNYNPKIQFCQKEREKQKKEGKICS